MLRAVEFSHQLLRERLFPGDMAIDATAGNGHDTHFLAQLTGPDGMVFAFDVQGEAIAATRSLLERWGVPPESWQLIHAGHETMTTAIPESWHGRAGAVLFNLGYLPGSDKSVTTGAETTVAAMRAALTLLRPGGILVAVLYVGHPGGAEEALAVRDFCAGLPTREFHSVEYRTLNYRNHPPSVIAIEKAGTDAEPEYSI
jgi:predicted methyltransferase